MTNIFHLVSEGISEVSEGISGVGEGISEVSEGISGVRRSISGVSEGISEIGEGISGVSEGISEVSEGISGFSEGTFFTWLALIPSTSMFIKELKNPESAIKPFAAFQEISLPPFIITIHSHTTCRSRGISDIIEEGLATSK